jgi:hypothetical protein
VKITIEMLFIFSPKMVFMNSAINNSLCAIIYCSIESLVLRARSLYYKPLEETAMANSSPVRTILLGNGLTLEIFDQSRKVAGDRWLVKLVAKIDIPIGRLRTNPAKIERDDFNALKASCGDYIRYEQRHERNFVDGKQKDAVFHDLMTSFLNGSQRYLAHLDFPLRCALREYQKRKQQDTWFREGGAEDEKP